MGNGATPTISPRQRRQRRALLSTDRVGVGIGHGVQTLTCYGERWRAGYGNRPPASLCGSRRSFIPTLGV